MKRYSCFFGSTDFSKPEKADRNEVLRFATGKRDDIGRFISFF